MQKNLLESHAAGTGPLLPRYIVRAAMLLRAVSLSRGFSGIRLETLQMLIDLLNADIIPNVPSQGSVGSSGDLAPLAHIAVALTGVGNCYYQGRRTPTGLALKLSGIEPITLEAKEGLALINGTQIMTAIMALTLHRAKRIASLADIAGAMTLEAVYGQPAAFEARLHELRPHRGQVNSAANIRAIIDGSELAGLDEDRIQDAYSIRCMPVVHGAARDTLDHVERTLHTEMNAVTDNPSIFSDDDEVISGGNFHGEPIALVADFLGIATAEIGNIAERRISRMLDGSYGHLPMFLVKVPGINSGLMIPQYTAAALVSENKGLAFPNSVDSITTSANQEDHNSMGTIAARNAMSIVENVEGILAFELITAAQALEFSPDKRLGVGTGAAKDAVREKVSAWVDDRYMYPDLEAARSLVSSAAVQGAVRDAGVKLN